MSTERLLKIKEQIDDAGIKQAEVTGEIKSVTSQMDQKFSDKNLSEAEKELKKIGDNLDKSETEFKSGMETLENAYPWN